MGRLAAGLFGLFTLASLSLAPARALAQDDTERARALFAEGTAFADRGEWAQAAERFRATLRLRQSPAVSYNLAVSLEHLGQLAEAAALLAPILEDRQVDRNVRREARSLHRSIEPRLAHLTIRLESDLAGATVRLDRTDIAAERIGREIAVDPGEHVVVLLRSGRAVERRQVSLAAGARESVMLGGERAGVATPEQAAQASALDEERPPGSEPTDDGGGGLLTRWWFWTAVVVVVAAGVTAGVLLAGGGGPDPVQGNLSPGLFEVTLP